MNNIEVSNIKKVFKTGNDHLEIFNIEKISFESNKSYAIKGSSGSGKSTFLQIVAGLEEPTSGSIKIKGSIAEELLKENEIDLHKSTNKTINRLRRENFGFIYQKNFLLKDLNVLDNLLIVKNDKKMAMSLLSSVGLESRSKAYYSELSGGERQRISICRSLMNSPDFIFADEPTGSLDFMNKEKIWDMLMELKEVHKFSLIMVTHDNELANNCENVYELKEGKMIREK